jgi:hypothetical protein
MPDYRPLLYWIKKREEARTNKLRVVSPITDDSIIAEARFCNVRREDDRVTIWIKNNIRQPYHDHEYLWLMLCIARQINWPNTLAELIRLEWPVDDSFEPRLMAAALNARKARGDKIYTGAYMISAPHEKGADKQKYIAENVIGNLWESRNSFPFNSTLEQTHKWLIQFNGWGQFMAYQAIVDMRFTSLLSNANDVNSWCAAGPGTIRGLNRIHERDIDFNLSQEQALDEIRKTFDILKSYGIDLDFSDVPNVYCETDKYMRLWYKEGKTRAKYIPGRGY